MTINPDSQTKARAWRLAARNLTAEVSWVSHHGTGMPEEWEHVRRVVIPSLLRRAELIECQARGRRSL